MQIQSEKQSESEATSCRKPHASCLYVAFQLDDLMTFNWRPCHVSREAKRRLPHASCFIPTSFSEPTTLTTDH